MDHGRRTSHAGLDVQQHVPRSIPNIYSKIKRKSIIISRKELLQPFRPPTSILNISRHESGFGDADLPDVSPTNRGGHPVLPVINSLGAHQRQFLCCWCVPLACRGLLCGTCPAGPCTGGVYCARPSCARDASPLRLLTYVSQCVAR